MKKQSWKGRGLSEQNRGKWESCSGAGVMGLEREGDFETKQVGLSDNLGRRVGCSGVGGGVGTDAWAVGRGEGDSGVTFHLSADGRLCGLDSSQ